MKKSVIISIISLTTLIACGGGSGSENGGTTNKKEIHGSIKDRQGQPVSNVAVKVQGSNNTTLTDENGEFQVPYENPTGGSNDDVVLEFDQNNDDIRIIPIGIGPVNDGTDNQVDVNVVLSEGQADLCSVSVSNQDILTNTDIAGCLPITDPLPPIHCSNSNLCGEGQFCSFTNNSCGAGTGECKQIPEVCIEIYGPVCGCDGVTYANSCKAEAAGISVAKDGEC